MKETIKKNHVVNIDHNAFLNLKEYCDETGYKMSRWLSIKIIEWIKFEKDKNATR